MPPRKPRPDLVDRATVAAMIAEAAQVERARATLRTRLAIRTFPTFRKK